jgi:hypothetical protein
MEPIETNMREDLGAVDMGDEATLAEFVRWGRENFPAPKTMLAIWSHGQGWRAPGAQPVNSGPAAAARYTAMRAALRGTDALGAVLDDDLRVGGGLRYVSNDDDTGSKLYNRAIQDVLTKLLAGKTLDLIAFDACLMAMVETGYALRQVAQVMVASEELEPGTGWNYEGWLQPLVAAPRNYDAKALGALIVDAMKTEYGDIDQTTLSCTDLGQAAELAASISRFSDAALPLLSSANLPTFRAARSACASYAPGYGLHSIDLGRYMQQFIAGPLASLRAPATDVLTSLDTAVIANYASVSRQGPFGSNGLAIYYPDTHLAYTQDLDGKGYDPDNEDYPVEFVQAERWQRFLHAYWRLVP